MTTAQEVLDAIDAAKSYFVSLIAEPEVGLVGFEPDKQPLEPDPVEPARKLADPTTYTANAVGG